MVQSFINRLLFNHYLIKQNNIVNKTINMKTNKIICVIFSLLVINISLYAQGKNNYEQIKELKGINNTYEIGESEIDYGVWNKQSLLMYKGASYLNYEFVPPINIENKKSLDSFVRIYFKPYFIKQNSFCYEYLYFYFFADINGNIKEIYISYPKNIGIIPGNVIEQFEIALLKSNVKLLFDKNNRVFKNSQWVGREVMYRADKMKDL